MSRPQLKNSLYACILLNALNSLLCSKLKLTLKLDLNPNREGGNCYLNKIGGGGGLAPTIWLIIVTECNEMKATELRTSMVIKAEKCKSEHPQ